MSCHRWVRCTVAHAVARPDACAGAARPDACAAGRAARAASTVGRDAHAAAGRTYPPPPAERIRRRQTRYTCRCWTRHTRRRRRPRRAPPPAKKPPPPDKREERLGTNEREIRNVGRTVRPFFASRSIPNLWRIFPRRGWFRSAQQQPNNSKS